MSVRVIRDIVYKEVAGQKLHLDLHLPEGTPVLGVVVYFHGGGFVEGDRADAEAERADVLAEAGFAVATVQYRFLDVAKVPAQTDDARDAVAWLRAHSAEYGFEGAKIGAWGSSAGAYMASALALGVPSEGIAPDVDATVAFFTMFDFRVLQPRGWLEEIIFADSPEASATFGIPFDPSNPDHVRANLIQQVSADASPFLLMTGDRDLVIAPSQSERMHEQLVFNGAESTLMTIGNTGHEEAVFHSPMVIGAIVGFFTTHLAK
ncbi:MAG TPA: alpha/beta hydrolase [Pseudolysinimonas sp.]|nr:alpha/beta hydrolase [Pseudolysinimonas sp.]